MREGGTTKFIAVLAAILAFSAMIVATAALAGGPGAADGEPVAASGRPETIAVELGDLFIRPGTITVPAGTDVTLAVTNKGGVPHDLTVKGGPATPQLKPGETAALHVGNVDGPLDLLCSIPGHADAGMRAAMAIGDAGAGQPATHAMSAEEMDESYLKGVKAFPAKTRGLGNQPLAPRLDGDVKVFELTASELDWEVAPGDVRKAMAYNGQVPGPLIRVNLGDRVRVVLHNRLRESTAVHFHGLQVPNAMDGVPGLTQPLVKAGESFTYEFTLRNAGTHMYHSHMNGAAQIPGGLLGALIVDAPGPSEPVRDEVMVLNDGPLGYTINGKGFPATQPIVLKQGEKLRIRYMNEGLQIHPMHLHGLVQTVVARDGYPLPQPYKLDTVLVAPGERIDVEVEATDVGAWAFHCHILTHAENEQGMFGMVTAVIVE